MKDLPLKLSVLIMKQGKRFVAYSPALDLSTCGRSERGARKRFEEAAEIFFEELVEAGTLDNILKDLGWQKEKKHWQPPEVISKESISFKVPALA